jgi:hypothetical protein
MWSVLAPRAGSEEVMRFDLPESITAMRAGRKIQTRRPSAYWLKKQPGDRITIVHKGEYLGHATVVRTWTQEHWQMVHAEALAEGYPNRDAFWEAWRHLYPEAPAPTADFAAADEKLSFVVIEFKDIRWK